MDMELEQKTYFGFLSLCSHPISRHRAMDAMGNYQLRANLPNGRYLLSCKTNLLSALGTEVNYDHIQLILMLVAARQCSGCT